MKKALMKLRHLLRRISIAVFLKIFWVPLLNRRVEQRIVFSWLRPFFGKPILDVACGAGYLTRLIAKQGGLTVGFDLRVNIIKETHRITEPELENCHFLVADAHYFPFREQAFSAILCNCSLEHFAHDLKALSEMRRVSTINGILILTVDSMKKQLSLISRALGKISANKKVRMLERQGMTLSEAFKEYHRAEYHVVNFYTLQDLEQKLSSSGFEVKRHRNYFSNISGLIFELQDGILQHIHWDTDLSRLLFPIFYPITFLDCPKKEGYGLAVLARTCSSLSGRPHLRENCRSGLKASSTTALPKELVRVHSI